MIRVETLPTSSWPYEYIFLLVMINQTRKNYHELLSHDLKVQAVCGENRTYSFKGGKES